MLIEQLSKEELIDLANIKYNDDFEGKNEKEFVESIYNKYGWSFLEILYQSLDSWDKKANFVKYFIREDCGITDMRILDLFQQEYLEYLVESGHVTSFCSYFKE